MARVVEPQPGMWLYLREEDYKFGKGPMVCEVVRIINLVRFDDVPWWHIQGSCAEGTLVNHGGWHDRELYVISSAVRARPKVVRQSPPGD